MRYVGLEVLYLKSYLPIRDRPKHVQSLSKDAVEEGSKEGYE